MTQILCENKSYNIFLISEEFIVISLRYMSDQALFGCVYSTKTQLYILSCLVE